MGQGSGDGCNRWVIGTNSMTDAYNEAAHQWKIKAPDSSPPVTQSINAFVDDVNLFIGKKPNDTKEQFFSQAQHDINRWHGILRSTGGELNTKKCFWSDFNLEYDTKGNPTIKQQTPNDAQLHLTNSDGTQEQLWSPSSSDGICHLGVHISMDGNQKAKELILLKCCQLFQKVYQQCPLTRQEAEVTYKTIFLPTITYPLPATTLSKKILNWVQSMTTPLILSKMGYNWNMPKAVVYTPTSHGGIGMTNLHTEQGVQQVLQLVKHLRDQTHLGNLLSLAVKA